MVFEERVYDEYKYSAVQVYCQHDLPTKWKRPLVHNCTPSGLIADGNR